MLKSVFAVLLLVAGSGVVLAKEPVPHHICLTNDKCDAYVGKAMNDDAILKSAGKSCQQMNGKWLTNTTCPSQGRNGLCKLGEGTSGEMWTATYGKPYDPATEANYINQ